MEFETGDLSEASMRLTKERPMYPTAPNNLELFIQKTTGAVQLVNEGYWGMGIRQNERYHLRTIVRVDPGYKGTLTAKLLSEKEIYWHGLYYLVFLTVNGMI